MSNRRFTLDPLKDIEFLQELDFQQNKETFARVTALTWDERPIEYIEGKVTGGSINLDGSSSVRRTCSLNMIAQDIDLNNFYFGLNSKIKIEIGLFNNINLNYPEIIWFPQGIYVLTTFNTSVSLNNYSISLSAKDKMCLLNGDVSGALNASIDFGVEEYYDKENDTVTYTHIPVKDIIRNAVHVYGGEPLHNIIINDLDQFGYELLEYRGSEDSPMYLIRNQDSDFYTNMTMNGKQKCWFCSEVGDQWYEADFASLEEKGGRYDGRIDDIIATAGSPIKLSAGPTNNTYQLHKLTTGDTAGYRLIDLIYPGDLISNIGETLTSAVLDKIKNMLGNFEYFYDLDGRFVFQQKKNNLYNNWNPLKETEEGTWVDPSATAITYSFNNSHYFTSISHNPVLNNFKNDFSIWGEKESVSGAKIPVHMRYALDRKPVKYSLIEIDEDDSLRLIDELGYPFTPSKDDLTNEQIENEKKNKYKQSGTYKVQDYDWRELIYRMAKDYFQFNQLDDFVQRVADANSEEYPTGYTGYEQYYTDMQGFWRQLYNPEEVVAEGEAAEFDSKTYWHLNVKDNPSVLNFWFDFLGEGTSMDKYLVPTIGSRTKVVNDKDVSAIYFKETPDVLFLTNEEYVAMSLSGSIQTGYTFIRVNSSLDNFFAISAQGKSAHDVLETLLYENTYCSETITINSIPMYYLQPNVRISINDSDRKIEGEYIISRISLPLTYNGTMSITATKAADTIY